MDRFEKSHQRAEQTHERAAKRHAESAEFWDAQGEDVSASRERGLAQKDRDGAQLERERQQLCREGHGSRSRQMASELREDRQVHVEPDTIQSTDAKRRERSLMLEASELSLDRGAAAIERGKARRLAWDKRVQSARLDPG